MAAVEVKERLNGSIPGMEFVRVEADDGQTYTATKLSRVIGAVFYPNEAWGAADSSAVTISGQVVTIELVGTTSNVEGTLVLYGRS